MMTKAPVRGVRSLACAANALAAWVGRTWRVGGGRYKNRGVLKAATPLPKELQGTVYKNATIKSIDKTNVVLEVDGKEVPVVVPAFMTAFGTDGKELMGKQRRRILREGNQVEVTVTKVRDKELISQIRLINGSLTDK